MDSVCVSPMLELAKQKKRTADCKSIFALMTSSTYSFKYYQEQYHYAL